MLDHVNLPVSNLKRSTGFYERVLKTLDMPLLMIDNDAVGFGKNTWEFGVVKVSQAIVPMHLAFVAVSHEAVQRFHSTALKAGGQDKGSPGFRPEYGSAYYAAYVIDPDGHNVEVVCRLVD